MGIEEPSEKFLQLQRRCRFCPEFPEMLSCLEVSNAKYIKMNLGFFESTPRVKSVC